MRLSQFNRLHYISDCSLEGFSSICSLAVVASAGCGIFAFFVPKEKVYRRNLKSNPVVCNEQLYICRNDAVAGA